MAIQLTWPLMVLGFLVVVVLAVRRWRTGQISRLATVSAVVLFLLTGFAFWAGRDARLSQERARDLVAGLLHNVYRAFDHRDEERIYDVLARSVEGDLLTQIYLETRRGLEIQNQGGARAKVKELEVVELEAESAPSGGILAQVVWDVSGSVGHWGHIHGRSNRYRASLGLQPVDGTWKLISMDVLEEERLPGP
jgi:hypothetical protein